MSAIALLGLVGLALVDSTSLGTLVLPLLLLLAPRVHVGRFLVYLATVALFYAAVGIGLVAGAGALIEVGADLADNRAVRVAELVLGIGLLVVGVLGNPRGWFRPRGRRPQPQRALAHAGATGPVSDDGPITAVEQPRRAGWRERLLGPDASYPAVVGVGLLAALVEVGSMLPFLAAVGIITTAALPVVAWVPLVLGYSVVMVVPALLLLAGRLALGDRVSGRLEKLSAWLDRHTGGAAYWAMAIVGLILLQDARIALFG